MYRFIIGADISKRTIDVSYTEDGIANYIGHYPNAEPGFKQMVKDLKSKTNKGVKDWFFCFENTGPYSKLLLEWLITKKIACREESALRISKSLGIKRAKNDKIDSEDICVYAFEKRHILESTVLPDQVILELRQLISYRNSLTKHKQGLMICLKEKKVQKQTILELSNINDGIIIMLKESIKELDQKIEELICKNSEIKENYELAKSVVGIGRLNAANIVCITENFTKIKTSRKMSCACGTAPFPKESGEKKGKRRVSQIGNKKMKALLSNAANNAVRNDHTLKAYYTRKIKENKEYGVVINAVKNKLLHRVFAVVKRKTPYVNLKSYA